MYNFIAVTGAALAMLLVGCARSSVRSETAHSEARWEMTVGAEMVFTPEAFTCAPGQKLHLVVRNVQPENGPKLLHSAVLLQPGTNVDAFGRAVLGATPEQDYIPAAFRPNVLGHTALIGPGQTGEIQMSAPVEPGVYPVVCTFPGHCIVGMTAKLVVR